MSTVLLSTSDICLGVTVIYLIRSVSLRYLASQNPTCPGKAFPFPECSRQHGWCLQGLEVRSSGQSLWYLKPGLKSWGKSDLPWGYINASKVMCSGSFCDTDARCHGRACICTLKFSFSPDWAAGKLSWEWCMTHAHPELCLRIVW